MAITGSQKALMYALSGVMRSGASRSGYVSSQSFISIGGTPMIPPTGTDPSTRVGIILDSLTITDSLDEVPNRCTFRVLNNVPMTGQEIIITLGSINNGERLFAGHLVTVDEVLGGKPTQIRADVSCVDYTWQLGFPKVTKRYTSQSATAIAKDLIATYAAVNGFTSAGVVADLPSLDEITYTNEDLTDALTRLARRIGGYWYVDYHRDLHFFLEDTRPRPHPIVVWHPTLAIEGFSHVADRSQTLTRVYVEGRGSRLLSDVAIGDTRVPLDAVNMFTADADVFLKASFQGAEGGAQHLNFTGVVTGGAGTLVGPGIGPASAPTLAASPGAGLGTGLYQYAVTFVTASGESLASPIGSVTTGTIAAPSSAPTPGTPTAGAGPNAGTHQYAVTFTTAAGETTPSALSSVVTTGAASIPNPLVAATGWTPSDAVFANLVENGSYKVKYAYATDGASPPVNVTVASPASASIQANNTGGAANNAAIQTSIPCSADPTVNSVWFYRTTNGGSTFYRGSRTANVPGTSVNYAGTPSDAIIVTQGTEPVANTTPAMSVVPLTAIPLGGAGVTGRKLYRTAAGASQLKLLATLADNSTTTFTDTVTDAALGANAPTTSTALANQVTITNVATGSGAVTARKIYRTVVNGAQLKLLATWPDNVLTSGLDTTGDGGLGANIPTSDTSGLTQPDGQIVPGATSILVAGIGAFEAGGGWAVIGNGEQLIRYTALTGNTLAGVPASGIGAVRATITYNSTITAAPMLTGIPASGTRSITRALTAGDELYLVVQVDDPARQAQLAAVMGGTGIREEWVQDRRLSIGEARARGQATLNVRPLDQTTIQYRCRDITTAAGKTVEVNLTPGLASPVNVIGYDKLQQVTIDNFRHTPTQYPTYTVQASSTRFSFEDWLRRIPTRT